MAERTHPKALRDAARELGRRIRSARLQQGLTLERAADRMHVDAKHLQRIESGRVNPTLRVQLLIARGLGISLEALMTRREAEPGLAQRRPPEAETVLGWVGLNIHRHRLASGMSQRELAERSGGSLSAVQQTELGNQNVTVRSLVANTNALGVLPSDLLMEVDHPAQPGPRPRVARRRARATW